MNVSSWLIVILYLLLPLGQLEKLPLGITGVSVYVHDLILVLIWGWVLWRGEIWRGLKSAITKEGGGKNRVVAPFRVRAFTPFFIFTAIALLSWLINYPRWGQDSMIGLGYLIRWILLSAPIFLLTTNYELPTTKLIKKSVFLLVLFGWVQYLIFPDLTRMKYFGWDDHYYRLTGTLLDPNFFGILVVIGLGLNFSNLSILSNFSNLFYLITLFFTYSRSSWLAWLVLLFSWGINKVFAEPIKGGIFKFARIVGRSLKAYSVYFWLAVSAIIFVLLPRPAGEGGNLARTASIQGRWQNYKQVWQIVKENPIFGVGFNNLRIVNSQSSRSSKGIRPELMPGGSRSSTIMDHAAGGADNSFLFVWATTGIFGLIAFLWLISSFRPWWLILPVCLHSLFNHSLFFPWVLLYLWGIQISSLKQRS